METKPFTSLRRKLILKITQILFGAFIVILAAVAMFSVRSTSKNLAVAESSIRASILAKGHILVANNSLALQGMVADNAFTAVRELVSSTVVADEDIAYGIYMDNEMRPWVAESADDESIGAHPMKSFDDDVSLWANGLSEKDHKIIEIKGLQVYEFAAPVILDEERMGTIRYGISTRTMLVALTQVREQSRKNMQQTVSALVLVLLTIFIAIYFVVRRMAILITGPISTLTQSAKVIADGDYTNQVDIQSDDEIGVLANNFDSMRAIVKKKIGDLNEINKIGEALAIEHSRHLAMHIAFSALGKHLDLITGAMFVIGEDDTARMEYCYGQTDGSVWLNHSLLDPSKGLVDFCFDYREFFVSANIAEDDRLRDSDIRCLFSLAVLSIPIFDEEKLVGICLLLCDAEKFGIHPGEHEYFRAIGRLLSIAMKNIHMRDVIKAQNQNLEKTVEERTLSLRRKSADIVNMMKHLHQGLFTIGLGGKIQSEYSLHLAKIFDSDDIAGKDFSQLLFADSNMSADDVDMIRETAMMVIQSDEMTYMMNKHVFFKRYERVNTNGDVRFIELDWNPIYEEGLVAKIMVTVRDVTDMRKLEEETAKKQRELQAVGALLHIDKNNFFQFIKATRLSVTKASKICQSNDQVSVSQWQSMMRDMHTIKGNARTYQFDEIVARAHLLETLIAPLEENEISQKARSDIYQCLDELAQSVGFYENIAVYKLEWSEEEGQHKPLTISQDRLYSGINLLEDSKNGGNQAVLEDALSVFKQLAFIPLREVLQPLFNSLPSLARQLDKGKPELSLDIDHVMISRQAIEAMTVAFTHMLRNALDHGIESPRERSARGKRESGTITIIAQQREGQLLISVYDDGRGLNIAGLKQKLGPESSGLNERELALAIFKPGISTAHSVTDISGRGIGLDAVQHALKDVGVGIDIVLNEQDSGDTYPFKFTISLPESVFVELPVFPESTIAM